MPLPREFSTPDVPRRARSTATGALAVVDLREEPVVRPTHQGDVVDRMVTAQAVRPSVVELQPLAGAAATGQEVTVRTLAVISRVNSRSNGRRDVVDLAEVNAGDSIASARIAASRSGQDGTGAAAVSH
ncbi:MAG TPA: hypothetical protein VEQ10_03665 [Vicinamibacteria bacterium]|nr:hypothetical protein [Vicinamibacteria bacterium]